MKTKRFTYVLIALLCSSAPLMNSCSRETASGRLTIKMTDISADYLQVNIEIAGMRVHTNTEGWVQIPVKAGIYDLLKLRNNGSAVLVDSIELPAGMIEQIKLELGANNSILTKSGYYPLSIPSCAESGLRIDVSRKLHPDSLMEITLDFDASASVVSNGAGGYFLKPVIKVI
jgi:hypothetical protein